MKYGLVPYFTERLAAMVMLWDKCECALMCKCLYREAWAVLSFRMLSKTISLFFSKNDIAFRQSSFIFKKLLSSLL